VIAWSLISLRCDERASHDRARYSDFGVPGNDQSGAPLTVVFVSRSWVSVNIKDLEAGVPDDPGALATVAIHMPPFSAARRWRLLPLSSMR
jgi:hypothetical protein